MTLLFGDEAYRSVARTKPVSSTFFSLLVHAAAVALLISINFSSSVLKVPDRLRPTMLMLSSLPPPPPPPPAGTTAIRAVHSAPVKLSFPTPKPVTEPTPVKEVAMAETTPSLEAIGAPGGVSGGVPGGVPGGVIGGVLGGFSPPLPPSPSAAVKAVKVPETPPPSMPQRIQVSGEVQEAMLIAMVKPEYPPLALNSRIQGTVRLAAIIDKDGKIADLKVVKGNPLLVDSALAAIRKWRYRPTFLNGEPVEVATQINVDFRLKQNN